jgi:hypothetical protein
MDCEMNTIGKNSKAKIIIASIAGCIAVLVLVMLVRSYYPSFSPNRLRHARWYLSTTPSILKYCFVPKGTTESEIVSRFGTPDTITTVDSPFWRKYIARETLYRPPSYNCDHVLMYSAASGINMITAHYYMDANDRLIETFIIDK